MISVRRKVQTIMQLVFALSVVACALTGAQAAATGPRPNFVFIMADDMGWGEVGSYPGGSHGNVTIATPNLDKLFVKEGLSFTNAYAGYTVCAPSRTTLFTGRHSGQFVKHGLKGTTITSDEGVDTLASILSASGYATGAFGKIAPLASPIALGFQTFLGQVDQAKCHNMYPHAIDSGDETGNVELLNAHAWPPPGRKACMLHPERYNYTIDAFQDHAMQWLDAHAAGPSPFFLYLSFTIPHAGGWLLELEQGAPVPSDGRYAEVGQSWPDVERDHAAAISIVDDHVGAVVEKLKEHGIEEDTLIIL